MKITTSYWAKPIPTNAYDWSAIDSDTYDASYEGEDENGHHWKSSPQGTGATRIEAIIDLLEQLELAESMERQLLAEELAKEIGEDYYSLPISRQSELQSKAALTLERP